VNLHSDGARPLLTVFNVRLALVAITKFVSQKYPGTSLGNMIFWVSFCLVGQPIAVLLYTVDYQYLRQQTQLDLAHSAVSEQCRVVWDETCLVS
jgi:hypothetical protein